MSLIQFLGALEIGLVFGLVGLGVFLSFRVLNFPDLTVDGSFPLGAAVCATLIVNGVDPWLATLAAVIAGAYQTGILGLRSLKRRGVEASCFDADSSMPGYCGRSCTGWRRRCSRFALREAAIRLSASTRIANAIGM